ETATGARLPDEPDARALPGRGAHLPGGPAPARRLRPLPRRPLRKLSALPFPRPGIRRIPADGALRGPQGTPAARPDVPGRPAGLGCRRTGPAPGRADRSRAVPRPGRAARRHPVRAPVLRPETGRDRGPAAGRMGAGPAGRTALATGRASGASLDAV